MKVAQADFPVDLEGGLFQAARLGDVFLLGPFMIWFAFSADRAPDWARLLMGVSGLMTMAFNARNYVLVDRVRIEGRDCCETLRRLT